MVLALMMRRIVEIVKSVCRKRGRFEVCARRKEEKSFLLLRLGFILTEKERARENTKK